MVNERSYASKFDDSGFKQCRRIGRYEVCLFLGGTRCLSVVRAWVKPEQSPISNTGWVSYRLFEGEEGNAKFMFRNLKTEMDVIGYFDDCRRNGGWFP